MTLDELKTEWNCLQDFRQWLEDKLLTVDIDIAANEQEQEELLNEMEGSYNAGC